MNISDQPKWTPHLLRMAPEHYLCSMGDIDLYHYVDSWQMIYFATQDDFNRLDVTTMRLAYDHPLIPEPVLAYAKQLLSILQ